MKNKLIILLTFIMLFAICGMQASAYSDIAGNEYEKDINILTVLGIAESFYEDEFLPDKAMSRADYCKMLVDITGEVSTDKAYYKDVSSDNKAFNQISYAYAQKIMVGYGNGIFRPDEPIKIGEAVKVMISFMGYNFKTDGSIIGAMQLGRQLGISDNIEGAYTDVLTRGMACRLIKNSLDIPIPEVSSVGKDVTYKIGNVTLLNKYKKMDFGKGVADANELISLKGKPLASDGCISINGENFICRDLSDMELVGLECEYIYRLNEEGGPYELVYVEANEAAVTVIDRGSYLTYADNLITYRDGERDKEIKISPDSVCPSGK